MSSITVTALAQGYLTSISLIVAIGAQNAFVIQQGLRREYQWSAALLCMSLDTLLIFIGVFGMGEVIERLPLWRTGLLLCGALILTAYAFFTARQALRGSQGLEGQSAVRSRRKVLTILLAISLLNPHVYLDTVLLIGSIGAQYPQASQFAFALGASLASITWFSLIAAGAARLAPKLQDPDTRRNFELGIAFILLLAALPLWKQSWQALSQS